MGLVVLVVQPNGVIGDVQVFPDDSNKTLNIADSLAIYDFRVAPLADWYSGLFNNLTTIDVGGLGEDVVFEQAQQAVQSLRQARLRFHIHGQALVVCQIGPCVCVGFA